jgi:hypothetical protein
MNEVTVSYFWPSAYADLRVRKSEGECSSPIRGVQNVDLHRRCRTGAQTTANCNSVWGSRSVDSRVDCLLSGLFCKLLLEQWAVSEVNRSLLRNSRCQLAQIQMNPFCGCAQANDVKT